MGCLNVEDMLDVGLHEAGKVAKKLMSWIDFEPNSTIWLFGSIARIGRSSRDIDLIVTVGDLDFQEFVQDLILVKHDPYIHVDMRTEIACDILGITERDLEESFRHSGIKYSPEIKIDLYLLPNNWRERINEVKSFLPHRDPNFFENIAKDAIKFENSAFRR